MTLKSTLVPGATLLAAATLVSVGVAGQGTGGNSAAASGASVATQTQAVTPPSKAAAGSQHQLVGISPQLGSTAVYRINTATGTAVSPGSTGSAQGSGLSKIPGTRTYFIGGGMTEGGGIYLAGLGTSTFVGSSGFAAVSGLGWNPAGTTLYGTVTVSVLADGLVEINPLTGAATVVGPMGIGGLDAIAFDPTSGTLYGSTGFFYDGNPGDVITINPATGQATDSFQDMTPLPVCTVAGMAFADDGIGYVSIGCGATGGSVHQWNTATNQLTQVSSGSVGFSMSDIEVAR